MLLSLPQKLRMCEAVVEAPSPRQEALLLNTTLGTAVTKKIKIIIIAQIQAELAQMSIIKRNYLKRMPNLVTKQVSIRQTVHRNPLQDLIKTMS